MRNAPKGIASLFTLFFISCFKSNAQVPQLETSGDYIDHIAVVENGTENNTAGYYQENKKYGFAYPENIRQGAIYDLIKFGSNGFIVQKGNFFGIADNKGVLVSTIEFDSIGTLSNNAYIIKKKGVYGTLSDVGKSILSLKYKKIIFSDGQNPISIIGDKKNEIQLIYNESEKSFPQKIDYAAVYHNLVIIKSNEKFGIVKNQVILPFEYDSIYAPVNEMYRTTIVKKGIKNAKPIQLDLKQNSRALNLLVVQKEGKVGLINSDGAIIFPPENDAIVNFESYGYYSTRKGNLYGIYFIESKKTTEIEFDNITKDGLGFVMATKNKKRGVFNLKGELIVPFEYDDDFIAQLTGIGFRVSKDKKRGIIDVKGNILVPTIYDDVNTFYENGFTDFFKVESDKKSGIVNRKGETIIPVEFDGIGEENGMFKVVTSQPDRKFGLYDKSGKVIIPATYQWITDSDTQNSKITILKKEANSYNFLNEKNQLILSENAIDYGYILDQNNLLNPLTSNNHNLLFIKDRNEKYGMLNEQTGILDIPIIYSEILQRFETAKHTYFSVKKGSKWGLINEKNEIIIPFKYDKIDLDFIRSTYNDESDVNYTVVVKKGKKFGTVNFNNEIQIPFQYNDLERISANGLYKAKKDKKYQIINTKGEAISKNVFDEVANFEQLYHTGYGTTDSYQALTFSRGKMRVINEKGEFVSEEIPMVAHEGYTTFDELKFALIETLDSPENALLKQFSEKIAPSKHILFYLKKNIFDSNYLEYNNIDFIKEIYFNNLLEFKLQRWNTTMGNVYNRHSLINVKDYTIPERDLVTNYRFTDQAFGDGRFLEKVLRNAVKLNGFWISSYFMNRRFTSN